MSKVQDVITGNAITDSSRGWIIGSFLDPATAGLKATDDVEIKWGVHKTNEERTEWTPKDQRVTIAILVSGKFEMVFHDQTVLLSQPGDFVMWGKNVQHRWKVLNDTTLITVRWPSKLDQ